MNIFFFSILFAFILKYVTSQTDKEIIMGEMNYEGMPGIQALLVDNDDAKLLLSLNGDTNTMSGKVILLLKHAKTKVEQTGVWAGVSFGSNTMNGADYVTVVYSKDATNKMQSTVIDGWCEKNDPTRTVKYDSMFVTPNDLSLNNVLLKNFTISEISVDGFLTKIEADFTKDLSKLDAYDWPEAKTWQTNKGYVIGSWGWVGSNGYPIQHSFTPVAHKLEDGISLDQNFSKFLNYSLGLICLILTFLA